MASRMSVDAEMKALLNGPALPCSKPHQLVPLGDDLVVAIASVAALDASLATAPPFKGVLRGYVLPTAPYRDAALLKAAAESGSYAAAPFVLLNHVVVGAKITLLDEAREQLENIVTGLNALQSKTLGGVRTQMMGAGPHRSAACPCGGEQRAVGRHRGAHQTRGPARGRVHRG
ncbi:hypothetical protein C2845_PM04G30890 [Panicum miliaceum]|uniref:Uncharacterized protein n=1 Tax=Panicum miliaceum TaxID=4540 RepID=A0A3L6QSB5_PANMI|nr:hypothetical protein C2845_PM04G30890 [Panicum miliaceum]